MVAAKSMHKELRELIALSVKAAWKITVFDLSKQTILVEPPGRHESILAATK